MSGYIAQLSGRRKYLEKFAEVLILLGILRFPRKGMEASFQVSFSLETQTLLS